MILARREAAPLRFLIAATIAWVGVRGATVLGWRPPAASLRWGPSPGALLDAMPVARARPPAAPPPPPPRRTRAPAPPPVRSATAARPVRAEPRPSADPPAGEPPSPPPPAPAPSEASSPVAAIATLPPPAGTPRSAAGSRLTGSAWAFVRGGGAAGLPPDGQIGGGQAGVRLLYRIGGGVAAAARVSRTVGGPRQTEGAVGLDWRPVAAAAVHVQLDRRIAIDRGGRDAWALGVAGGAYAVRLGAGGRADGYVQAGVVGARSRDLYGDGGLRVGRELAVGARHTLTLGGGAWAAAQPGARRLDAGPGAVLRLGLDGAGGRPATLAVALDWRARIAGGARPGSGPALTVGMDF